MPCAARRVGIRRSVARSAILRRRDAALGGRVEKTCGVEHRRAHARCVTRCLRSRCALHAQVQLPSESRHARRTTASIMQARPADRSYG